MNKIKKTTRTLPKKEFVCSMVMTDELFDQPHIVEGMISELFDKLKESAKASLYMEKLKKHSDGVRVSAWFFFKP